MIIKTFSAKTLQDAKAEAYQQLGPQAIILNTRQYPADALTNSKKENFFEVTAAIEPMDETLLVKNYSLKEIEEMIDRLELSKTEPLPKDNQVENPLFTNLCLSLWQKLSKKETTPFENLIDHLSVLPQPKRTLPPQKFKDFLMYRGIEEQLAELIEKKVTTHFPAIDFSVAKPERDGALQLLWRELVKIIQIYGPISFDKKPNRSAKIVTLLSSERTDKKMVAAKLAYQYASEFNKKIMIVSLEKNPSMPRNSPNLAEKISYKIVFSRNELQSLLEEENDQKDLIIIDCFGCRLDSWQEMDLLCNMLDLPFDFESHLVIDAFTKNVDAARIIKNYQSLSPVSFMLTGLNETYEPGLLVNLCVNSHLPISYLTNDAEVTQPLEIADAPTLARYLLTGALQK